jgi:putative endopeptidase
LFIEMHMLRRKNLMKRFLCSLTLVLCAAEAAWMTHAASPEPVPPRFSVKHMDRSVAPGTDFARFAFGTWLKNNLIPEDKSSWSGFDELAQIPHARVPAGAASDRPH